MSEETRGDILQFKRTSESYLRKARSLLDDGDLMGAYGMLKDGERSCPGDWQAFRLAQAHVLNQMQRFEHSQRVLLTMMPAEQMPEEGVYGAAENFLAMEEFGAAHTCLELYLKKWPDGMYAGACADTLRLLHSGEELSWHLGLEEGEDPALIAHIHLAKAMHFSMRDEQSLNYLLEVEKKYPDSLWLQMEIALDQFCIEDYQGAEQRVFNILKRDRGYVRARCLLALIRLGEHKDREAREMMDSIPLPEGGSTEELGTMCAMLLEIGDYERAEKCAGMLTEQIPYDTLSLHEEAFAKAMLGKWEEACERYTTLVCLDPQDPVAYYYLGVLHLHGAEGDPERLRRYFSTNYDVPYEEAIRRFNDLKKFVLEKPEELKEAWQTNEILQDAVRWALYSPLFQMKNPIFAMLGALGDVSAHELLADFLLRMDQSDQDKQMAIAALKEMGDEGPYTMYYEGAWRYGMVKTVTLPEDLPLSYRDLFEDLGGIEQTYGLPEGTEELAKRFFYHYVNNLQGEYPRMNREQRQAMLAALAAMALHLINQKEYDTEDMAGRFDVSLRRLHNALKRLLDSVANMEENGEEDPS